MQIVIGLIKKKLCDLFLWSAPNVEATTKTNTLSKFRAVQSSETSQTMSFGDIFDIDLFVSI
jgi:hypothetical protein